MRKIAIAVVLFGLSLVSAAGWAAGQIKPGLWEMTLKSDAMKNMPKMSPEQIEKMRQMGLSIPQMQEGGMVTKVCISKEMAEREGAPQMDRQEAGCQTKNYQRSGSSYSLNIVCDGPHLKGEGVVKGAFSGNQAFNSTYDFKGSAQGRPVDQHHESSGKWLSADCGNVKPMDAMIPKK